MISAAQDVASARELTDLVGGKLQLICLTRQVLHLNHECWNPKSMDDIAGIESQAHALTLWKIERRRSCWCSGNDCTLSSCWVLKLPRPLETIDRDFMFYRCCLIHNFIFLNDREVEKHRHDNERDDCVENFNRNVVLSLLRKFTLTCMSSMENRWPKNQNESEDSNYCLLYTSPSPRDS